MPRELKVGDKVRIRSDLLPQNYGHICAVTPMLKYRGETTCITQIIGYGKKVAYRLEIDGSSWNWSRGMFVEKGEFNSLE